MSSVEIGAMQGKANCVKRIKPDRTDSLGADGSEATRSGKVLFFIDSSEQLVAPHNGPAQEIFRGAVLGSQTRVRTIRCYPLLSAVIGFYPLHPVRFSNELPRSRPSHRSQRNSKIVDQIAHVLQPDTEANESFRNRIRSPSRTTLRTCMNTTKTCRFVHQL